MVKVKKEITPEGNRKTGNRLETVHAKFAFLTDTQIPKNAEDEVQVKQLKKELKKQGIKLDPYKFDLEKEEELMVQPIPLVAPKTRRFGKSIFDDTWATIKIPESVRRHWKKENKEVIQAREQEREARGLNK